MLPLPLFELLLDAQRCKAMGLRGRAVDYSGVALGYLGCSFYTVA
jgi:hypothetical protein